MNALRPHEEAHAELDLAVLEAVGDGGDAGEGGADREGDDDDAVGVDTHQFGGVGVLRGGLHAAADAGLHHEPAEGEHADRCGDQQEDVAGLDGDGAHVDGVAGHLGEGAGRLRVGVPGPDGLLQGQREADGGDEGCEAGCAAQWAVGEAFGSDRYEGGDDHGAYEHEWQGEPHAGAARQPEPHGEGAEAADHEDLAVGEVDELDDAIDHCVADGDQAVHGSQ